jgi:hypothetical protein
LQRGLDLDLPLLTVIIGRLLDRGVSIDDGKQALVGQSWEEAGVVGATAVYVEHQPG